MESIEQVNYIKANKQTVYNAITTKDGLSEVWTQKLSVEPRVGFINEFDFDEGYITKMKIEELEANSSIVWKCIASDEEWVGTTISFKLTEKDGLTTVSLIHADWKARTEYYKWCSYNWALFLYRLKKYCEGI